MAGQRVGLRAECRDVVLMSYRQASPTWPTVRCQNGLMTVQKPAPEYEFDVAVTFASEDRAYVQEVVEGVKAAGFTPFYDDDHVADMWGENGIEFLTNVYQNRARYVVMFVSRHYAEKMWTRLERRAALARAMTERNAYVLPVRLDDTELDGLLPTTIYVDANRVGLSGLVELIKTKLGGTPAKAQSAILDGKVPRSQEAIEAMIAERPVMWEYLLYAGMLKSGLESLETKYRDHTIEYASSTGVFIKSSNINDFVQAALAEMQAITENFGVVLDPAAQSAAFGEPGHPGDVDRILHLAQRYVSVYESLLDWSAEVRGASIQGEHGRAAARLLAKTANQSVESLRNFVNTFVAECDTILERVTDGEAVKIKMVVNLDVEDALMERMLNEFRLAIEDD